MQHTEQLLSNGMWIAQGAFSVFQVNRWSYGAMGFQYASKQLASFGDPWRAWRVSHVIENPLLILMRILYTVASLSIRHVVESGYRIPYPRPSPSGVAPLTEPLPSTSTFLGRPVFIHYHPLYHALNMHRLKQG